MRALLIISFVLGSLGCHCTPATPQPVTLRIKNDSRDTLYVDDSRSQLGLTVQRRVNDTWFGFDDQPCACRSCDQACDSTCSCPDASVPFVQVLRPDQTLERTWNGVVQVLAQGSCGECLSAENAPYDESFRVELCYVTQLGASSVPDAGRFSASFPAPEKRTCQTKEFLPNQKVVELGPLRGAACMTDADCKGKDELCFDGSCTAGCPSNEVPNQTGLVVASVGNQGYFDELGRDAGVKVLAGTGRITSVLFQGATMNVSLDRVAASGEHLRGSVQVSLPMSLGAPLSIDAGVTVRFFEDTTQVSNNAVTMRDSTSGALLFAADSALSRRLLTPNELTPYSLEDGAPAVGCRLEMCGKLLFFPTKLVAPGATVALNPGKSARLNTALGVVRFVVGGNNVFRTPNTCTIKQEQPFALWRE